MTAFLVIAGVVVLGCLGLVFAPMLRGAGRGERRASYDMQVYRDQLREIEADHAQGRLSAAEAEATRIEVARRLIAASDAEAAESDAASAPRRLSRGLGAALVVGIALGAGLIYDRIGAPGYPDHPLALRLAGGIDRGERPSQAEAEAAMVAEGRVPPPADAESEALITQLEELLQSRPDDLEGHRLLARSLAALGRIAEARAAQEKVVELLGPDVEARDLSDLAELMIFAAGGYVSPEAETALAGALQRPAGGPARHHLSAVGAPAGRKPAERTLD